MERGLPPCRFACPGRYRIHWPLHRVSRAPVLRPCQYTGNYRHQQRTAWSQCHRRFGWQHRKIPMGNRHRLCSNHRRRSLRRHNRRRHLLLRQRSCNCRPWHMDGRDLRGRRRRQRRGLVRCPPPAGSSSREDIQWCTVECIPLRPYAQRTIRRGTPRHHHMGLGNNRRPGRTN
jgi:hypothetical protein